MTNLGGHVGACAFMRPQSLKQKGLQPAQEKSVCLVGWSVPGTSEFAYSGQLPTLPALKAGPVSKHPVLHASPPGSILCCAIRRRVRGGGLTAANLRPSGWKAC